MSDENGYAVDVDYQSGANPQFAATSGRIGGAAAANQAGRVAFGYDPTSLLAPFRLDAGGSIRVAPATPGGGSVYVYTGQPLQDPAANQFGQQIMVAQPLPNKQYMPLTVDAVGALNVHEKAKVTWRMIAPSVQGGASKSIFSIFNGTQQTILRIQQVNLQTPYVYTTGGNVLGLASPTNQSIVMLHEMRRISGHTRGATATVASAAPADTQDVLDPLITAYSNATLSGVATAPFHRADANSPSGLPWYLRGDANQKTLNLRPSEGMTITSVSDTTRYTFDIEVIATVAPG
ncbi:MAG: hypothetical protein EOO40_00175 [Deltaproteobacteria bacterium]|nr:MAG: hypothetical protein EOO40_00175 [Deltaproteobacteria bacterium]